MSDIKPALEIGAILFPDMDQADFTGPFEVLSQIPNSRFHVIAKTLSPVKDARGLLLIPQKAFSDCPPLDLLLVPGGAGVNQVMTDPETLAFIREKASAARLIMSVCTGALVLGAAGLLKGRRATTHWASHHFLAGFGAVPANERVCLDGNYLSTAGVTAGMDGALRAVAILCGDQAAQEIQLYLQYSPEPPFNCGSPETAPEAIKSAVTQRMSSYLSERSKIISRITAR